MFHCSKHLHFTIKTWVWKRGVAACGISDRPQRRAASKKGPLDSIATAQHATNNDHTRPEFESKGEERWGRQRWPRERLTAHCTTTAFKVSKAECQLEKPVGSRQRFLLTFGLFLKRLSHGIANVRHAWSVYALLVCVIIGPTTHTTYVQKGEKTEVANTDVVSAGYLLFKWSLCCCSSSLAEMQPLMMLTIHWEIRRVVLWRSACDQARPTNETL